MEPETTPPGDNVNTPINTGSTLQNKIGDLLIGAGLRISSIGTSLALKTNDTNETARVVVGQDGKVGIGTTTPSSLLDVNGTVKASSLDVDGTLKANEIDAPGIVKQLKTWTLGQNISTTSTSYVNIPGLSNKTITTGNSHLYIMWNAGVADNGNANRAQIRILVDGVQAGTYMGGSYDWDGGQMITVDSMSGSAIIAVNSGTHTISLQWRNSFDENDGKPDTLYIWPNASNGYGANLNVMEISR